MGHFTRILGLFVSVNVMKVKTNNQTKQKVEDCSGLPQTKEYSQPNAMCTPSLNSGLGENLIIKNICGKT